jgi:putative hemolysin
MEILIIIFLILLNGVFSMSEIALVSSKKFKLENLAKNGNTNAKRALELSNKPGKFLATVQIGITLIGILTGVFSGDKITLSVENRLSAISFIHPYAHALAVIIVVIVVTYLSIVLGELIPKRIGMRYPEKIATAVAAPMGVMSQITAPFIWLLTKSNDVFLRMFGINENNDAAVTEEEIKAMIQSGTEGGDVLQVEQNIVERVFELGDRRISELMTHRSEVVWLELNDDLETVKKKAAERVYSFYPVAKENLDSVVGVLILKDLFPLKLDNATFRVKDYLKKPLIVHDNSPAYKVLEKFREHNCRNALVVDEYGSVKGVVSLDDLLDVLIGNIPYYNANAYQITKRDENSWLIDGQYPYFELLNYFNLPEGDDDETDFNTVAGLILYVHGHVPTIGEKVKWRNFILEVVDMDGLRIDKILISAQDS